MKPCRVLGTEAVIFARIGCGRVAGCYDGGRLPTPFSAVAFSSGMPSTYRHDSLG